MFLNPLQEHLSYNQLSKQVKSRNKQIRFLQDKIILLQNERESKIAQIQSRFLLQIERFKQTQKALQQQAILLRRRLQKRQLSYSSLQQSYRQLSNQVKVLTQSNSSSIKQSKSMKRRYNQQQHEMARIQQENIQLKSLINILQKQLRELTQKNIKLLQQKSWLMNTYQDYEHVRYQLQEIRSVHNDQYKKQVQIVKSKFRQQMDSNTRKILGQQLMNGYTGVNRIGQLSENMGGTIPRSKTIQKEDKEDKQLMNNQTKKREQNYSLKEKVQSRQQSCGKCVFESSWSEDLIKLKHLIQYGEEYLSVISKQQQLQQQQQQLQQQQLQQLQQQQQQQQQYPTYQQSKPFSLSFSGNLTFNHSQSKQILAFILQILNNNQLLKIQLHEQSLIFNKIKHQFQQQTQSLLNKINQLTLQQSQRDHQLQQIQKQYQQKHQLQSNQYMLQLNQHKLQLSQLIRLKQKLYLSNQKSNQSKKLISVLSKLIAKISLNYLNLWNKHQLQHKLINCTNNKHPSNNMNNNYLQQDPNYQKQRTQTMITSKSKESTKIKIKLKLKLKLKKVILSLIFIAKLKKASSKLRRKTLLIQGYKKTSSKKNINTINKQQNQYQNNSLLNIQHEEQSQFYTQSTYDLILNHYHIPRQIQIQCQFNFSQINHKLSSQKIHQLLLKCLFQTLKDQILHSKSIQSENLQIQKFFNNIQKSQKLASIHQSAIKIVCQQIFLQKTF